MDAKELALTMLKWSDLQAQADQLKSEIEQAVLELGESQQVGDVKATYRRGRKKYDYGTAFARHGVSDIHDFEKVRYDYRAACKADGIDDIPFTQGNPSVSVELV